MSKSPSKANVSVGSALSLAAEVTKALSPVLRGLSQEHRDTQFFLDNVVDEFGDKHEDVNIDLSRFSFQVMATEVNFSFALKIEAYLIESVRFGKPELAKNPIWTVEFEQLVSAMYADDSLVPAERAGYFGINLESKMTEEYVARNGILKFWNEADNLHVGLQIGDLYLETPLSYRDARLFEVKRQTVAQS